MNGREMISKLQSNIAFRVTSFRDMLMSVRSDSAMNPLDRRKKIRQNRLEMLGMRNDDDMSQATSGSLSSDTEPSAMEEPDVSESGRIRGSTSSSNGSSGGFVDHNVPSMDEVERGTKSRAENNGFGDFE